MRISPEPESEWDALLESGAIRTPITGRSLHSIRPKTAALSTPDVLEDLRADER